MADPALLEQETVEVVVQVNGRIRDRLHVPPDTPDDELEALARASERVQSHLDGDRPARVIVVPGQARELRDDLDVLPRHVVDSLKRQ